MFEAADKTPIERLESPLLEEKKVTLYIKRDDLIHPQVSGNKWRKLKYNLLEAKKAGYKKILTFGGAFSNHIYALAAAGKALNMEMIGMIRGEPQAVLNSTLQFAEGCGMELHYVDRETYRMKNHEGFIKTLKERFGDFYLVPEGGTNELALQGVAEMVHEIDIPFDYICTACGTGGTLAGIVEGLKGEATAIGFPVLKGAEFLEEEVKKLLPNNPGNWEMQYEYHFGGYAKIKKPLVQFMQDFEKQFNIPLEPVYTAKMLFGLMDLVEKDYFKRSSTIIAVHTGGLQGLEGMKKKVERVLGTAIE